MNRLTATALVMICAAAAAGCGTNANTTTGNPIYGTISSMTASGALIGGNVQASALSSKQAHFSSAVFRPWSSITFGAPISVTNDGNNSIYVANHLLHNIYRIYSGNKVRRFAGSSFGLAGFQNASSARATFYYPTAITSDGSKLYVADGSNHAIRKIDRSGYVSLIAGDGVSGSDDSSLTVVARFSSPTGITAVGSMVYVVDSGNHTIRKVDPVTRTVTTLAGFPGTSGSSDGDRRGARFYQPSRITSDGRNLYVTDFGNKTVRMISLSSGTVTTIAGRAGIAGASDGPLGRSLFNGPSGIATDGIYLYVTDFPRIVKDDRPSLSQNYGTLRRIKLFGGYSTATILTGLNTPVGLAVDSIGLYVTDRVTGSITRVK